MLCSLFSAFFAFSSVSCSLSDPSDVETTVVSTSAEQTTSSTESKATNDIVPTNPESYNYLLIKQDSDDITAKLDKIVSDKKYKGTTYLKIGNDFEYINANGDAEPCVFIHYSNTNIRENTLLEILKSPLFMLYHKGQPFNDNMLRPCPMLENPDILPAMVKKAGAHSTDLQAPETAEELCSKCKAYADTWKPVAESLWEKSGCGCQRDHVSAKNNVNAVLEELGL